MAKNKDLDFDANWGDLPDFDLDGLDKKGSRSSVGFSDEGDVDKDGKESTKPATKPRLTDAIKTLGSRAGAGAVNQISSALGREFKTTNSAKFITNFTNKLASQVSDSVQDVQNEIGAAKASISKVLPEISSAIPQAKGAVDFATKYIGKPHDFTQKSIGKDEELSPEERAQREKEEKQAGLLAKRHDESSSAQSSVFSSSNRSNQFGVTSPGSKGVANTGAPTADGAQISSTVTAAASAQHKDAATGHKIMSSIGGAVASQASFLNGTFTAYLKKDLELKYRTLYLTEDLLNATKIHSQTVAMLLDKIRHNTGLPDSAKQPETTASGYIKEKLSNTTKEWFDSYTDKFMTNIKENVKSNIGMLSMPFQALDMANGLGGSMGGGGAISTILKQLFTDGEDLGTHFGKQVGGYGARKAIEKIILGLPEDQRKQIQAELGNLDVSIPLLIDAAARGKRPDVAKNIPDTAWSMIQAFASMGNPSMDRSGGSIFNTSLMNDPTAAGTITNRFITTVEDVIPSYLRLQTRFLEALATGKSIGEVDERAYSFQQGKMTTSKKILADIHKQAFDSQRAGAVLSTTVGRLQSTEFYKNLDETKRGKVNNSILDIAQVVQNLAMAKKYEYSSITPEQIPWFQDVADNGKLSVYADDEDANEWYKVVFLENINDPQGVSKAIVDIFTSDPNLSASFNAAIKDTIADTLKSDNLDSHKSVLDSALRKHGYGALDGADAFYETDSSGNRKLNEDGTGYNINLQNIARSYKVGEGHIDKEKLLAGGYADIDYRTGKRITAGQKKLMSFVHAGDSLLGKGIEKLGDMIFSSVEETESGKKFLTNVDENLAKVGAQIGNVTSSLFKSMRYGDYVFNSEIPKLITYLKRAKLEKVIPFLYEQTDTGYTARKVDSLTAISDLVHNPWLFGVLEHIYRHQAKNKYGIVDGLQRSINNSYKAILNLGKEVFDKCLKESDPVAALADKLKSKTERKDNPKDALKKQNAEADKIYAGMFKSSILGTTALLSHIGISPSAATAAQPDKEPETLSSSISASTAQQIAGHSAISASGEPIKVVVTNPFPADAMATALTNGSVASALGKIISDSINLGGKQDSGTSTAGQSDKDTDQSSLGKVLQDAMLNSLVDAHELGIFGALPGKTSSSSSAPTGLSNNSGVSIAGTTNPMEDRPGVTNRDPVDHLIYQTTLMQTQIDKLGDLKISLDGYLATLKDMGANILEGGTGLIRSTFGRLFGKGGKKKEKTPKESFFKRNKYARSILGIANAPLSVLKLSKDLTMDTGRVLGRAALGLISDKTDMVRLRPAANQKLEDTRILITKEQFKAGVFKDKEGKKRITSIRDITGPVYDGNGDELISKDDIKHGLVDGRGKPVRTKLDALTRGINHLVTGAVKGTWSLTKKAAKAIKSVNPLGRVWDLMKSPISASVAALIKWRDVYSLSDMSKPLVTAREFQKGLVHFADGTPLKDVYTIDKAVKWADIPENGSRAGQIAISEEDITNGLVDHKGKKLSSFSRKLGSLARRTLGKSISLLASGASLAFRANTALLRAGLNFGVGLFKKKNPYIDVYVKDESGNIEKEPRLLGIKIKEGDSYFYLSGAPVKSAYGITDAVYSEGGKTILITEKELTRLCSVDGKSLTSFAGSSFMGKIAKLNYRAVSAITNGSMKLIKGMGKLIGGGVDFLTRKMWSLGAEAVGLAYGSLRDILGIVFGGGSMVTRKDLDEIVGERLDDIYELIADRYGVEDDRYAEEQRKELIAERNAKNARNRKDEPGMIGKGFRKLGGMLGFGNNDDEDSGSDDYDTDWDNDRDRKRSRRGRARRPRARISNKMRISRIARGPAPSTVSNGIRTAGNTVGKAAKGVVGKAAKMLGKGALKTAGRVAARVAFHVLTKIPAVALVAGVAVAGYYAYKWYTNSKLEAKVRAERAKLYGVDDPDKCSDGIKELERVLLISLKQPQAWPPDADKLADIAEEFGLIETSTLGFGGDSKSVIDKRLEYFRHWVKERVKPIFALYVSSINQLEHQKDMEAQAGEDGEASQDAEKVGAAPDPFKEPDPAKVLKKEEDYKSYIDNLTEQAAKIVEKTKDLKPTAEACNKWLGVETKSKADKEDTSKAGAGAALVQKANDASVAADQKKVSDDLNKQSFLSKLASATPINKAIAAVGSSVIAAGSAALKGAAKVQNAVHTAVSTAWDTYNNSRESNGVLDSLRNAGTAALGSLNLSALNAASIPDGGTGDLGQYVAKFESAGKGSSAIGWDVRGGTSYGKYQIAARVGTFKEFIKFAKSEGGEFGQRLAAEFERIGEANWDTGRNGLGAQLWQKFAQVDGGKALAKLEKAFIHKTHFSAAMRRLADPAMEQLIMSDRGLKEAMWSTSVQHGAGNATKGAAGIFNQTYRQGITPEEWLRAIYAKRSTQFGKATPDERAGVINRFKQELPIVLGLSATSAHTDAVTSTNPDGSMSGPDGESNMSVPYSGTSNSLIGGAGSTPSSIGSKPTAQQIKDLTPKTKEEAIARLQAAGVKAFNTTGGGGYNGVAKLNDKLLISLAGAVSHFQSVGGPQLSITSAWRSPQDQAGLQGTVGAAKVGRSPHQRGLAVDIGDANGGGVKGRGYGSGTVADLFEATSAKYFGLQRPYNPLNKTGRALSNEEQHFELSKSAPDAQSPESLGLEGGVPLAGNNGINNLGVSQSATGDKSLGNLLDKGKQPQGTPGANTSAMSAGTTASTVSASGVTASSSGGGSSSSSVPSAGGGVDMSSSTASSPTNVTMQSSSSPLAQLSMIPSSSSSESSDNLSEMKTQSNYLGEVVAKLGELITLARTLSGATDSNGATTTGGGESNTSSELANALETYLGANSPILQALGHMANGSTNATTTKRNVKGHAEAPTVLSSPINTRKTRYA